MNQGETWRGRSPARAGVGRSESAARKDGAARASAPRSPRAERETMAEDNDEYALSHAAFEALEVVVFMIGVALLFACLNSLRKQQMLRERSRMSRPRGGWGAGASARRAQLGKLGDMGGDVESVSSPA